MPWGDPSIMVDLYGYAPFDATLGVAADKRNLGAYPFSVKEDQSAINEFKASDFLWSKSITPTLPTSKDVHLTFTHRLSKIKLNLKAEKGFTQEEMDKIIVQIHNVGVGCDIDMGTGIVTLKPNKEKTIIPFKSKATSGYNATFEAIVAPQTITKGTSLFSLRSNEYTTPYVYNITESIHFTSGKEISFNVNVSRKEISVVVDQIKPWETTSFSGNINSLAPMIIDLRKIDWSKSLVHNVMYNNRLVAQVFKEYLKNWVVQAITVYPVGSNGKLDLNKGFIAQVMVRDLNLGYIPAPENIHGGAVSWIPSLSITPGTKSRVDKVQIIGTTLSVADANTLDYLTITPNVLVDIDGNNYRTVKIGTNYWMAESLKVEHFISGDDATFYYYGDNP